MTICKKLTLLFESDYREKKGDCQQGAEDIDVDHSIHKFAGLSSLFIHNSQKKDDNDRQSSENVDGCHNIVDIIHKIYSLISDTLEYHARNEKSKPNKAEEKFIDPDTMGPMTIAAKITCPMSRKISENAFVFS